MTTNRLLTRLTRLERLAPNREKDNQFMSLPLAELIAKAQEHIASVHAKPESKRTELDLKFISFAERIAERLGNQ